MAAAFSTGSIGLVAGAVAALWAGVTWRNRRAVAAIDDILGLLAAGRRFVTPGAGVVAALAYLSALTVQPLRLNAVPFTSSRFNSAIEVHGLPLISLSASSRANCTSAYR